MIRRISILSVLLCFMCCCVVVAESRHPIGFAYWDVDCCYDTIPSLFYDDNDYTPQGRKGWNTHRYRQKIRNIVSVVDSMRMPLVALYGVESEGVVRDIVTESKIDYCYLHRTNDGRDGLDFALLYLADMFFIDRVESFYDRLYIEGEIEKRRVGIWLTRNGYLQKSGAPPHQDSVDVMILAGGFYRGELKKIGVADYCTPLERKGYGNAMSYKGWYMRHRIGVNESVDVEMGGVYIKKWLLRDDYSAPRGTYSKGRYMGGYSNYLPLFIHFTLPDEE
ncbi:MAG: hypothetical protein SNG10_00115 [Rikenellaceae bacterium]